jgi:hypothetical protein
MTPGRGQHFRVLRDFLDALPPKKALLPRFDTEVTGKARVWSLVSKDTGAGAVWLFATDNAQHAAKAHTVTIRHIDIADYEVTWIDDVTGTTLSNGVVSATADGLALTSPPFAHHAAARFQRKVIRE